jgi:hypothetical protein
MHRARSLLWVLPLTRLRTTRFDQVRKPFPVRLGPTLRTAQRHPRNAAERVHGEMRIGTLVQA